MEKLLVDKVITLKNLRERGNRHLGLAEDKELVVDPKPFLKEKNTSLKLNLFEDPCTGMRLSDQFCSTIKLNIDRAQADLTKEKKKNIFAKNRWNVGKPVKIVIPSRKKKKQKPEDSDSEYEDCGEKTLCEAVPIKDRGSIIALGKDGEIHRFPNMILPGENGYELLQFHD
ncbi:Oidioi.mRNA.OKI2018_I69.PAR.g10993.t1.cds [Oikopleura dioica]|uniref:Oidioi.mRNA.OKI2018_I69.PAR.g10993.t1.cds n=1 Tax=Oikopleura dioica TaxID=34765 RepID=A0ABN7RU79_OIKDI|nr:Oidioi.mRNA.OKI2018_I69.PAR.g10993.t1.cds [Oikopleura dioica]